jgi:hypothetical protein
VHEVSNPHEGWFLASQHAGAALTLKSSTRNLRRGGTVFRSFAEDDLYAEIQLIFRDEPQSPMLTSFVNAILRMRERLLRGKLHAAPLASPAIPRPLVKPRKAPRSGHHNPRSLSS